MIDLENPNPIKPILPKRERFDITSFNINTGSSDHYLKDTQSYIDDYFKKLKEKYIITQPFVLYCIETETSRGYYDSYDVDIVLTFTGLAVITDKSYEIKLAEYAIKQEKYKEQRKKYLANLKNKEEKARLEEIELYKKLKDKYSNVVSGLSG